MKYAAMLKKLFLLLSSLLFSVLSFAGGLDPDFLRYIERYKDIAIQEMERAGIPASIKLAQGILESDAGRSVLAKQANNHFGIKCGEDWRGGKLYRKDDEYDSRGKLIESCFRSYRTVEACYIAHSEFLRDPKKEDRYGFLFRIEPTDYRRWAVGLKRAGYATSATYAEKLIDLIERYELHKYDRMSTIDLDSPSDETIVATIMMTNDVKYTLATANETVAQIAARTDVALKNLLDYNEQLSNGSQPLPEGTKVYIQPKRNAFRGRQTWHSVQPEETMYDIAQRYGLRLSKLYKRNRLSEGAQPAVNEKIKLRGGKVGSSPKLRKDEPPKLDPIQPEVTVPDEDRDGRIDLEPAPEAEPEAPVVQPAPNRPVIIQPTQPREEPAKAEPQKTTPPVTNPPPPDRVEVEDPFALPKETTTPPPAVKPEAPPTAIPGTPSPANAVYHTVETGDTLWNISRRYNTTVEAVKKLNGMTDIHIKVGMRLRVQ